jgi:hypothetical protein
MTTLCETFRSLAFRTHDHLARARRVGHQPLEETFTDINILELKDRHPHEVYSKTFTKHEEGVNGADWEWWLTNSSRTSWLGLRVQAKILHLATNTFQHLHYRSGTPRTPQIDKLRYESNRDGLIPLYCFYTHFDPDKPTNTPLCRSFHNAPESYGCAITSLDNVAKLRLLGKINDLDSVLEWAMPWHCLVCCSGYSQGDLPTRSWAYLKRTFDIEERERGGIEVVNEQIRPGPRPAPPSYVYAAMEGDVEQDAPSHIQGVLVLAPRNGS